MFLSYNLASLYTHPPFHAPLHLSWLISGYWSAIWSVCLSFHDTPLSMNSYNGRNVLPSHRLVNQLMRRMSRRMANDHRLGLTEHPVCLDLWPEGVSPADKRPCAASNSMCVCVSYHTRYYSPWSMDYAGIAEIRIWQIANIYIRLRHSSVIPFRHFLRCLKAIHPWRAMPARTADALTRRPFSPTS